MKTATRSFTPETVMDGFNRLENLLAMTSALVEAVNLEMIERNGVDKKENFLLPDGVACDILWQIGDNFIEMKAVRGWLAKESMKEGTI